MFEKIDSWTPMKDMFEKDPDYSHLSRPLPLIKIRWQHLQIIFQKLRGIWLKTQARKGAKHSSLFFPTIFYTYVNKYIFVTEPEWRDIFAPDISSYVILIVWWLLMNSCHNGGFRWDVWKNRLLIFSTEYHLRERIHRCSDFRQQRETILRWF